MFHRSSSSSMRRRFLAVALLVAALPVAALASPVDIPHSFVDGGTIVAEEFNENFDAIAVAVNDNDARIAALETSVAENAVPAGTIAFFAVANCPAGWVEHADLRGRVPLGLPTAGTVGSAIGTALDDEGTRTISQVVAHTHGPGNLSGSAASDGSHTHSVDPVEFPETSNTAGSHSHTISLGQGGGTDWTPAWSGTDNPPGVGNYETPLDGSHSHTVNVDVPATTSTSAGAHTHSVSVTGGATSSAGVATVDVTMPYLQLLACAKS